MAAGGGQDQAVSEARAIAYRYLGNREHSRHELREKLLRRGVPEDIAFITVDELAEEGLVSDRRFAEAFARSRISRLQGPFKIRSELRGRGVSDALIDETLGVYRDDWVDLASDWVSRRCRGTFDRAEKARLYRGGTRRGFDHEQMMRALESFSPPAGEPS